VPRYGLAEANAGIPGAYQSQRTGAQNSSGDCSQHNADYVSRYPGCRKWPGKSREPGPKHRPKILQQRNFRGVERPAGPRTIRYRQRSSANSNSASSRTAGFGLPAGPLFDLALGCGYRQQV